MGRNIPLSFFNRGTPSVARDLLGTLLVRVLPTGERISGMIVETEAYLPFDAASHAFRGRTQRNASMFERPGTLYVYFTYGMHFCLNAVTESIGVPAAVLIRALEPRESIDLMCMNRKSHRSNQAEISLLDLCSGPARICQALGIDRSFDGSTLSHLHGDIRVEVGQKVSNNDVAVSHRIGIRGDTAASRANLRWYILGNPCVSHIPKANISEHKLG